MLWVLLDVPQPLSFLGDEQESFLCCLQGRERGNGDRERGDEHPQG